MKSILITLYLLISSTLIAQPQTDYFNGKRLYCGSENQDAMELFNMGVELLQFNSSLNKKNLELTSALFYKAYKIDTTFCDAIFFAGYAFRLLNDRDAFACYYIADSLAENKSIEFKINLAKECLRIGNEKSIKIAREKYNELVKYFPESPEGYYGIALSSTIIGDIENGLKNIEIAIEKYSVENNDALFLKAILLTLISRHDESLVFYKKVKSYFKRNDYFNGNYALSLYNVAKSTGNEKTMMLAQKHYKKVKNKYALSETMRMKFEKK